MGHEVCAVAFYLLVGGDGAKDDFGKLARVEWAVGDSPVSGLAFADMGLEDSLIV